MAILSGSGGGNLGISPNSGGHAHILCRVETPLVVELGVLAVD